MNNLLSAGFARLKKSKIFWILVIFMFAMGLYMPVSRYFDMKKYGYAVSLDNVFFLHVMFMGVITAVFISLFLGTEYSDGAIRNKLVVGHSRIAIYFSSLIVCVAASAFLSLAFMAACACTGLPLLGFFKMDIQMAAALILCDLAISATYSALFTFAAMLVHNKAILSTVTILAAFLLLFAAAYLYSALSQPEMRTDYVIGESGAVENGGLVPNESYVSGTKRDVYEFLMEFLPSGQDVILCVGDAPIQRLLAYDCLIILVSSGAGLFGFLKKDIK